MWDNSNVTSLVAWFTAVLFATTTGASYMRKPFHIYHETMRLKHKFLALPAWTYMIVWPILIALDVAALFLFFNYVYAGCAQTYYIVASAFALATLAGYLLWPIIFVKWGSARGGLWTLFFSFASAGVVFGMMIASMLNTGCPAISSTYPTGAIATAFWGVQLVWLMIQLYTSYRWMLLPSHERDYRMWLWHHKNMVANKIRAWMEKRYGKDGNYGAEDDSGGWEEDERVDSGDAWDDVRSNLTLPLIRKAVVKGD